MLQGRRLLDLVRAVCAGVRCDRQTLAWRQSCSRVSKVRSTHMLGMPLSSAAAALAVYSLQHMVCTSCVSACQTGCAGCPCLGGFKLESGDASYESSVS